MSADLLRRAAKALRDHATIATSSPPEEPWTAYRQDDPTRHGVYVELRWRDEGDAMPSGYRVADMSLDAPAEAWPLGQAVVDSQYIALMHPPVALALADWLDKAAEIVQGYSEEWKGRAEALFPECFAVARAILREGATDATPQPLPLAPYPQRRHRLPSRRQRGTVQGGTVRQGPDAGPNLRLLRPRPALPRRGQPVLDRLVRLQGRAERLRCVAYGDRGGAVSDKPSLMDRLFARVIQDADGCWIWTGALNKAGYGAIGSGGKVLRTHRVMYEHLAGPIPAGLQLDHLCRVRSCCNPGHLDPVTNHENWMRGEHHVVKAIRDRVCKRGHALSEGNYYTRKSGGILCRTCVLANNAAYRERRAAS